LEPLLKGFPKMQTKQKLQLIIALMKFHTEAKNMALVKLLFIRFWFSLFLVVTCYCKRSVNMQ